MAWIDEHMDVVLVHNYEAVWWQEQIHADEISAAIALHLFCGGKAQHRSVVSLAGDSEPELV